METRNEENVDIRETSCCIVGGGPAGVMLSLFLARRGVRVDLLEAHKDFDREFRGDTLHPSTMEVLDHLGLADRLLEIPHTRLSEIGFETPTSTFTIADFNDLNTKFPYITVMPQSAFLDFVVAEARQYENFTCTMNANVKQLVEENGKCVGVRYQSPDGWHEVRADVVIAADGRASRLRKLAGFEPVSSSPPMDVLWLRVSSRPGDPHDLKFRVRNGHILVVINRGEFWQLGYIILKGSYRSVKEEGIEAFREAIAALAPELADRVDEITDWKEITPLNVEANRLKKWHRPGLLFIGDAAHAMSPVGGVGINIAIGDAVAAANELIDPLLAGDVRETHLAAVQKKRQLVVRLVQNFQTFLQNRVVKSALHPDQPVKPPFFIHLPLIRQLPARMIGYGIWKIGLRD
ncbi:MAG: FAD-dependent oxidoreductase [Pirellulaceae bacterium]